MQKSIIVLGGKSSRAYSGLPFADLWNSRAFYQDEILLKVKSAEKKACIGNVGALEEALVGGGTKKKKKKKTVKGFSTQAGRGFEKKKKPLCFLPYWGEKK